MPDEQRLHEATGNEGVSLERAYRRAAIVLWPRSRTLAILAGAGIGSAVTWLAGELERNGGVADTRIRQLASELTGMWPTDRAGQDTQSRARMLALLCGIGDKACISHFLHEVILSHYTGSENEELLAAMDAAGTEAAGRFLPALIDAQFTQRPKKILALLRRLDDERDESADAARREMLRKGVRSVLRTVAAAPNIRNKARSARASAKKYDEVDSRPPRTAAGDANPDRRLQKRLDEQAVLDLFTLAWRGGLTREAEAAAGAIAALPRLATPDRTLPAALRELHRETGLANSVSFAMLWRHATGCLLERSASPPKEPRHWKIAADIDCNCDLCADLRAFCNDAAARVARFPLRKDLRAHLHRVIDHHRLDLDHETERRGRPYTLVCTKNRASHRRRLAEYAKDVSWMRRLIGSAPGERRPRSARRTSRGCTRRWLPRRRNEPERRAMAQLEHIEAIEKRLWEAADTLRANSNYASNEYFLPVMGLVFLRHAYSRYLAVKDEIAAALPTRGGKKRAATKQDFSRKSAIFLRPEAQFDHLVALPDGEDRARAIIAAMESIEADYDGLRGVLPKGEYQELDNDVLGQLLRTLNPDELKRVSGDVFGRIYEYFLTRFADQKAHDGGEFFTPFSLVSLIAHVLGPDRGTVLDPAAAPAECSCRAPARWRSTGRSPAERLTFGVWRRTRPPSISPR